MTEALGLKSNLLSAAGFPHAFFTRRGGVSKGPYESLSFSVAAGDHPEHVDENLRRAASSLGVEPGRIYFLSQVHGSSVRTIAEGEPREAFLHREGDAVISRVAGHAAAVRSADCVPILVADRASGAVAAIHAGWRGVAGGVVASAVGALREMLRAPGDLIAAIGPHISVRAFEVSHEVAETLAAASPEGNVVVRGAGKPHVDLRRIVRAQLEALKLAPAAIDDVFGCTVSEPEHFFSYRRDGPRSGRHVSAIVPRRG